MSSALPASFSDLGMPAALERAITDLGFTTPSAIQAQAVPALLDGRDIVGVAQTGTGKTAAFGLPLLAAIDPQLGAVQAVVLTPTRELAMQVADAIQSFATHLPGLTVLPVYGGSPFLPQQRALQRGAQVVVGTPGRVIDHLERRTLVMDQVRFLVLDEADEMLRMGFAEDVDKILSRAPQQRQVALFSATMPTAIRRVAETHLNNPLEITVARQSSTVTSVRQTYAVVPFRHKVGALSRVLAVRKADAAIVFVRTRGAAEEVGSALIEKGISAAYISGDVAQGDREKIVDRLRTGALDVLVATDVAARGLDVDRIGLVVNFDVPREPETYVHRIGRTGRAGREGEALSFVTPSEQSRLRQIERTTRVNLEQISIPSPADVSAHRVQAMLGRAAERAEAGRLDLYRESIAVYLAQHADVDPIDLLATLTALAVGDEGPGVKDDMDDELDRARLAPSSADRGDRGERGERGERRRPSTHIAGGPARWRVAVGHRDGVQPGALVGALTGEGGLTGKDVGKIDIFGSFSLVDIPGGLTAEAMDRLSRTRVAGRPLRIRMDSGPRTDGARTDGPRHESSRPGHYASRPTHGPRGRV
ncbi:DEAD/DEAH box helicase [Cellulomonas sp. PhB150]|uniref:DEAD/DEAH box helicase n=1 Tax=Cellulomonas sp. PhB150 TaxID=2485188 RepID=UPI000F48B32B|nr:DEAD/DEAH box helicase [Cellulomonas sp. PhB150]ROS30609.1 ATP-dependent RNA helicase DeaD [Cellulomonas sp. PhB150]